MLRLNWHLQILDGSCRWSPGRREPQFCYVVDLLLKSKSIIRLLALANRVLQKLSHTTLVGKEFESVSI